MGVSRRGSFLHLPLLWAPIQRRECAAEFAEPGSSAHAIVDEIAALENRLSAPDDGLHAQHAACQRTADGQCPPTQRSSIAMQHVGIVLGRRARVVDDKDTMPPRLMNWPVPGPSRVMRCPEGQPFTSRASRETGEIEIHAASVLARSARAIDAAPADATAIRGGRYRDAVSGACATQPARAKIALLAMMLTRPPIHFPMSAYVLLRPAHGRAGRDDTENGAPSDAVIPEMAGWQDRARRR